MDAPNLAPVQSGQKIMLSLGAFASDGSGKDLVGKQRIGSEDPKMQYIMKYSNLQQLVQICILRIRAFCQAWIYREGLFAVHWGGCG